MNFKDMIDKVFADSEETSNAKSSIDRIFEPRAIRLENIDDEEE